MREAMNRPATGQAYDQQAELYRLRGDYAAAEGADRDASRYGREPQPGLALLRVAQGEAEGRCGAPPRARPDGDDAACRFLPADVEVAPVEDQVDDAASASAELDEIEAPTAARYSS